MIFLHKTKKMSLVRTKLGAAENYSTRVATLATVPVTKIVTMILYVMSSINY